MPESTWPVATLAVFAKETLPAPSLAQARSVLVPEVRAVYRVGGNGLHDGLAGSGAALSRLGGGIGTRGPGETKLETDRRRIRVRIQAVQREIEQVRQRRGCPDVRDRLRKLVRCEDQWVREAAQLALDSSE